MKLAWSIKAWNNYLYWQKIDKKKLKRVNLLIRESIRNPFDGMGKPERLKHEPQRFWSKRIDKEHRLVYSSGEVKL